ncbi:MAG: class II aldolase/adducin family protein [Zetaproteobacteria bacterium]|nr:MAG: class II aldolase/adducin family protein [Zetaproteobacteria bacterium]
MEAPTRQLVHYYRALRKYGLNDSHSGNASVRVENGFWITPTGANAEILEEEELVFCAWDAPLPAHASSDAALHRQVYARIAEAGAVLHAHCPYAVALTMEEDAFAPQDLEGRLFLGKEVPVLAIPVEEHFQQAPEAVAEALAYCPVCIERAHGVYAWGKTLDHAYQLLNALESSARLVWLRRSLR